MASESRKGILLAGGSGTRLQPATLAVSKQLIPIYDKPMVYYPLSTLMLAGIREILIISTQEDSPRFRHLLGNGRRWGIELSYAIQPAPRGVAEALLIAEPFLADDLSALILGDNIFYGHRLEQVLGKAAHRTDGATVFAYHVNAPEQYGVVTFGKNKRVESLEEKPPLAKSSYAVTGLYFYDQSAVEFAKSLSPSERNELEITDLNRLYLERGGLHVEVLGRGFAWLDAGTHESMLEASQFIATLEKRQGLKVSCPEEIAFRRGWITAEQLQVLAENLGTTHYGRYLSRLLHE